MSFLLGSISGVLVASGVYYGFSNRIQTRTTQLRTDLHKLVDRIQETPSAPTTPTASDRVVQRPFTTLVKSRWNQQVEDVFKHVGNWDKYALDLGRKLLYGSGATSTDTSSSHRE